MVLINKVEDLNNGTRCKCDFFKISNRNRFVECPGNAVFLIAAAPLSSGKGRSEQAPR
jgi:hypothetical protein